ncbi:MAG: hypothetical protein R3C13_01835 [Hyphomonas sp.]
MRGIAAKLVFCVISFGAGMAWGVLTEAANKGGILNHVAFF